MSISRRNFLGAASAAIVPASVFGQSAPSKMIRIAQIGCGRIARGSEFAGLLKHHALARYVAVCDLDSARVSDAKSLIETYYEKNLGAGKYDQVATYSNYQEMLADKSIDAVCISTPDHWHAQPAMEAALAGKDIYLQKPASLTIREGRQMADVVKRTGTHLPARQPAALRHTVPLLGRIDPQRTPRQAQGDLHRSARRPAGRRRARNARPRISITTCGSARRPRSTTPRSASIRKPPTPRPLRPPRLAALRAVRRRHDHRLGRAPYRHRALGHGPRSTPAPPMSSPPPSSPRKDCWTFTDRITSAACMRQRRHRRT